MSLRISLNRLEEWPELSGQERRLKAAARLAARSGRARRPGEISITFVPDAEMRELHRRWLGRDAPTDVLAFDLGDEAALIGDVYIAPATAARNAGERGVGAEEEAARLVIHAVLHLVGHDHPEGEERYGSPMFRLQEELLTRLPPG